MMDLTGITNESVSGTLELLKEIIHASHKAFPEHTLSFSPLWPQRIYVCDGCENIVNVIIISSCPVCSHSYGLEGEKQ